ncbi:hypothetical protein ASPVEDRAFT_149620 [Aspergillus versicolor CBS 583.65]|uniref:Metalloendopeptidase n=1 Tax=Aspergillus versicolor CBS 583.65 TaxID=1036611 RepID=A0A1L9PGT7_ASPVE|nr:uncharacterized protein ASPVEDRAFT_149620 [Aspergillus versicolor CBS 583.65]OJJ00683.1 hypothetical protein ASPVEDRAFT_149620 [Aspergillus versicolor CBS 583.65]
MRSVLLFILALLLVSHSQVEAGSRLWERPHNHAQPRWAHFPPPDENGEAAAYPWPDKVIPVCFKNPVAKQVLAPFLRKAMDLWYAAGLPESYKLEEASDHRCANQPLEVLMVRLAEKDEPFSTTVGRPRSLRGGDGARMKINLVTDLLPDVTANIAHELGHSWGLFHEHQTSQFWDLTTGMPKFFTFNCEALSDFPLHADKTFAQIYSVAGICRNYYTALSFGFGATEFLAIPFATSHLQHMTGVSEDDVDWKSIMLYPSNIGSRFQHMFPLEHKRVSPNQPVEEVKIQPNIVPSPRDVEGIRHIYESPQQVLVASLLNDPTSAHFQQFQQLAPGCA